MFKKSRTAEVTPKAPAFSVRYLGKREAPLARGPGCTQELMGMMWEGVVSERQLPKARLTIHRKWLDLSWVGSKESEPQRIPMQSVTYCSLDRAVNGRIFSWIHAVADELPPPAHAAHEPSAQRRPKYWCVAVVASNTDKARAISVVLQRSFLTFYKDSVAAAAKSTAQSAAVEASLGKRREAAASVGGGGGGGDDRSPDERETSEDLRRDSSGADGNDWPDSPYAEGSRTVATVEHEQRSLYADAEIAYDGYFATMPRFEDVGTNDALPSAPYDDEASTTAGFYANTLPIRQPPIAEDRVDPPCTSL